MAYAFKQSLNKGIILDADELRIPAEAAAFLKNLTTNVNANPSANGLAGFNAGVYTPIEGNTQLTFTLPSGNNFCIGFYSSEQNNSGYFAIWNSGNLHSIYVTRGDTGVTTLAYQGALLPFVIDPQFYLSEGRMTLELRSYVDPVSGNETNFEFLIFTNNLLRQYFIEIPSSIATSSFSTTFFTSTSSFYNPVELIHLGAPTPLQCMSVTPVTPSGGDALLQNLLIRNGWQFRIKWIDVFGRESEHGIISSQYITIVGGGCVSLSNGLPRCVNLAVDAGNPLVAYIQIEFRQWKGDDRAGALQTGWSIYDTISKYDTSGAIEWYNRTLNPGLTYVSGNNTFTYQFCADKANVPIDPVETSRTEPGLPRISNNVFSINKRIGLANNVRGFQPIDPTQVEKITFAAVPPSTSSMCKPAPTCTIIVFVQIISVFFNDWAFVRRRAGRYVFGRADDDNNNPYNYDMVIADGTQSGLTGYLVGFPEAVIGQNVDFNPADGSYTIVPPTSGSFSFAPMQMFTFTNVPIGEYLFRLASHKVKISTPNLQSTSTYVAGLINVSDVMGGAPIPIFSANPLKEIKINACTAFQGEVVVLNGFSRLYPTPSATPIMILADPTVPYSGSIFGIDHGHPAGILMDGYLNEDNVDNNPIEMQAVNAYGLNRFGGYMDTFGSYFTDHNGFYWAACPYDTVGTIAAGTGLHLDIKIDACNGTPLFYNMTSSNRGVKHTDGSGTPDFPSPGIQGYWGNKIFAVPAGQTFPDCGRRFIEGQIDICSTSIGIGGVPIVITKGALAYTNSSGAYEIIAHNRYNVLSWYSYIPYHMDYISVVPDYSTSPNNQDILIIMTRGACTLTSCDGMCTYCLGEQTVTYIACVSPTCGGDKCGSGTCVHCRITTISTIHAGMNGVNIQGVQSGGRYPVGFILHDEIGRHTFVQTAQGDAGFVDIPPLISYEAFALCSISMTIPSGVSFPSIFTKMTPVVAPNINFSDFFCWECDYVQFVDITGQTNVVNPAQIRLYYGSNNEYQKQYNYSTNVGWEFITNPPPPAPPMPVEGDLIEFIQNGDGSWFTQRIIAQVTYDQVGTFITIDYTADLANLKQFALFKVIRPIQNQPEYYTFYEQCLTIKLTAGVPTPGTYALPYVDSYMLSRILPIPLAAGLSSLSGTTFQYTNNLDGTSVIDTPVTTYAGLNNNKNGVIIMRLAGTLTDIFQVFPYYFESPSPSDTWGSHIANRGRIFTVNPYESQQRSITEIALSDALGDRGVLNGLSYFEDKNIQTFDRNTWGQIVCVIVETSTCLVICDSNHFVTMYNQSVLRQTSEGTILAQNPEGAIFTSPERKSGQNFGCTLVNINTIRKYLGYVYWLDPKGRLIRSTFGTSVDVSTHSEENGVEGGYSGYLMNKISEVNILNQNPTVNGNTFFIGGIDPRTKKYYLTSFNQPHSGAPTYGNTQTGTSLTLPETMEIDLASGLLTGFPAYTPEYYGAIPGFVSGKNFFSFKQGGLWKHHAGAGSIATFANFYGVQYPCIVTLVVNPLSEKVKRFLYVEIYCRTTLGGGAGVFSTPLFISNAITTEKGQTSRLVSSLYPTGRWKIVDGFQSAQILCDLNTPVDPNLEPQTTTDVLFDGNPLIGRWAKELWQTAPGYAGTYFELSSVINYFNTVEKSGG